MRYRIDNVFGLYRLNGFVPEEYDFKLDAWKPSRDAEEEFHYGLSSYEATEQEAANYLEREKKNLHVQ